MASEQRKQDLPERNQIHARAGLAHADGTGDPARTLAIQIHAARTSDSDEATRAKAWRGLATLIEPDEAARVMGESDEARQHAGETLLRNVRREIGDDERARAIEEARAPRGAEAPAQTSSVELHPRARARARAETSGDPDLTLKVQISKRATRAIADGSDDPDRMNAIHTNVYRTNDPDERVRAKAWQGLATLIEPDEAARAMGESDEARRHAGDTLRRNVRREIGDDERARAIEEARAPSGAEGPAPARTFSAELHPRVRARARAETSGDPDLTLKVQISKRATRAIADGSDDPDRMNAIHTNVYRTNDPDETVRAKAWRGLATLIEPDEAARAMGESDEARRHAGDTLRRNVRREIGDDERTRATEEARAHRVHATAPGRSASEMARGFRPRTARAQGTREGRAAAPRGGWSASEPSPLGGPQRRRTVVPPHIGTSRGRTPTSESGARTGLNGDIAAKQTSMSATPPIQVIARSARRRTLGGP